MSDTKFNIDTYIDGNGNVYVKEQAFRQILEAAARLIEDQRVALRTHDKAKQQNCMARENRLLQIRAGYVNMINNNMMKPQQL